MAINCPSCETAASATLFSTHLNSPVEIDICWSCHLIWFDHLESVSLSAKSVIDLFRLIHEHREDSRRIVSLNMRCPVSRDKLVLTNDIGRAGRFSYYRSPEGHGRLISFVQFLREKNFIRTLNDHEIVSLSATVKQIRCSSCGAGIDISHDHACTHCGSPISVLDEKAVAKALADLDRKANRPPQLQITEPASAPVASPSYHTRIEPWREPERGITDLVLTGLAAILAASLN
jgi:Zn-finger nucleic acid-binding protein